MARIKSFDELGQVATLFPKESPMVPQVNNQKLMLRLTPEEEYNKIVSRISRQLDKTDLEKLKKLIPSVRDGRVLLPNSFYPLLIELGIDPDKVFNVLRRFIDYKNSQNYGTKFESTVKLLASLVLANSVLNRIQGK